MSSNCVVCSVFYQPSSTHREFVLLKNQNVNIDRISRLLPCLLIKTFRRQIWYWASRILRAAYTNFRVCVCVCVGLLLPNHWTYLHKNYRRSSPTHIHTRKLVYAALSMRDAQYQTCRVHKTIIIYNSNNAREKNNSNSNTSESDITTTSSHRILSINNSNSTTS